MDGYFLISVNFFYSLPYREGMLTNTLGPKSCSFFIPELKEGKDIQSASAELWDRVALTKGYRIALYLFYVLGKNSVTFISDKWDQFLMLELFREREQQLTKPA